MFGLVHEGAHSAQDMLTAELLDRKWVVTVARCVLLLWSAMGAQLTAQLLGFRWPTVLTFAAAVVSGAGVTTSVMRPGAWEGFASVPSDLLSSSGASAGGASFRRWRVRALRLCVEVGSVL